jgi:GNAT superfamily N-acetyltransferase
MSELTLVAFPAGAAAQVSAWAPTAGEVAAWCSRTQAPVPPEVVAGWSDADDVRAYLLLADGRPVAYGEIWTDDEEDEVELAHLVVDPARRGQGIGRALAARLAQQGKLVHDTVFLRLVPGNLAAEAAYRAAGFVRIPDDQAQEWNKGQPQPYRWMTHQP